MKSPLQALEQRLVLGARRRQGIDDRTGFIGCSRSRDELSRIFTPRYSTTLGHCVSESQTSKVYPQCCSSEHFALPKWFFDSGNSTVSKINVPAGLGLDSSMSSMVSEPLALVELRSSSKLKDDGQKHVVFRYRRLGYREAPSRSQ
ncbi:hypothetical protein E4U37_007664 [Claviceps purpurea]|nr:hypothetical protein E4U37_007664 [Claviceps purpurea]